MFRLGVRVSAWATTAANHRAHTLEGINQNRCRGFTWYEPLPPEADCGGARSPVGLSKWDRGASWQELAVTARDSNGPPLRMATPGGFYAGLIRHVMTISTEPAKCGPP